MILEETRSRYSVRSSCFSSGFISICAPFPISRCFSLSLYVLPVSLCIFVSVFLSRPLSLPRCLSLSHFSLAAPLSLLTCISILLCFFRHLSIFSISLFHHLTFDLTLFLCVGLSASRVSTRVFTILAKTLIGSAWVTCTLLRNTILYMGCRQPGLCPSPILGTGTGLSRSWC